MNTVELDELVIAGACNYNELVVELVWNIENGKSTRNFSTLDYVINTLKAEKTRRESNPHTSVGGRSDIGVFMYLLVQRTNELKAFSLLFNNSVGNLVHNARVKMNSLLETYKDNPGGAIIYLTLEDFWNDNDRSPTYGKGLLNASLGHVE